MYKNERGELVSADGKRYVIVGGMLQEVREPVGVVGGALRYGAVIAVIWAWAWTPEPITFAIGVGILVALAAETLLPRLHRQSAPNPTHEVPHRD